MLRSEKKASPTHLTRKLQLVERSELRDTPILITPDGTRGSGNSGVGRHTKTTDQATTFIHPNGRSFRPRDLRDMGCTLR